MTRFTSWDSYFIDNPRDPQIPEDQRVLRNLLGETTVAGLADHWGEINTGGGALLDRELLLNAP